MDHTVAVWLHGMGQLQATASLCLSQHKNKIPITAVNWIQDFAGQRALRETLKTPVGLAVVLDIALIQDPTALFRSHQMIKSHDQLKN